MSLIDDLKEISIVDYLVQKGYPIAKETCAKVWFNSPLHPENNPSFVVFKSDNKFVDYGISNRTASIVDLVMDMEHCSLLEAMGILKNDTDTKQYEPVEVSTEPLLTVSKVLDKYIDPRLLVYLKQREIPESIYSRHTKEVRYWFKEHPDKVFSGIGFENDSHGWEIRSAIHKLATAPKDITTINNDGGVLTIFEGFINMFSALVYFGIDQFEGTTIVLNGLGMIYKVLPTLKQYQKVNCFFDWGVGGDKTTELVRSIVGAEKCFDHRCVYPEGMDFNDYLISLRQNNDSKNNIHM